MVWTIAWKPYPLVSACAANQYVAATTRYGELSRRAPQKPSVARSATCPGRPWSTPDLGDGKQEGEGERLAGHHRRHRPPERQAPGDDRERAEHVHHRVEEEGEVDREEVAPADGAELGRDRLDAVLLDPGH